MTATPKVSMLWESVDPAVALTDRFGFADALSAAGWMGDALSGTWAISIHDCDRLVISHRNLLAWVTVDDRRLIAKLSVSPSLFQRLTGTANLRMWLQTGGIPLAAPIPASDGRLQIELNNGSLGVCPVIKGDLLDVGDPAQVTEAGQMLATLHGALAAYPHRIDGGGPTGREQLVHNDFRSANILYGGTSITAVLDFEDVTYRTRVADLAKATVLLGARYRDWGPTSEVVRDAFVAAYGDQASLTNTEQNELRRGITAVLTHFGSAQKVHPRHGIPRSNSNSDGGAYRQGQPKMWLRCRNSPERQPRPRVAGRNGSVGMTQNVRTEVRRHPNEVPPERRLGIARLPEIRLVIRYITRADSTPAATTPAGNDRVPF